MGWNNPSIPWSELEQKLSDRRRPGGPSLIADGASSPSEGRYGCRFRLHAGLSPPSAMSDGPPGRRWSESLRSSSDHGIDGLFQPIAHPT